MPPLTSESPPLFPYPLNDLLGTDTFSRWVVPLTGFGVVTLPDDPAAVLYATKDMPSGLMFATDTADLSRLGHGSLFPGYTSTIILQIPTLDSKIPEHNVLHAGACTSNDTIGLAEL